MEEEQPQWALKLSKMICLPQRVILSIMLLFGVMNGFTMRACLSMAITRIVVKKNTSAQEASGLVCEKDENDPEWEGGDHDWSQFMQGFTLSAFYIGYVITHLPGGILADRFGGKYVLSIGILLNSICTLITPWVIDELGLVSVIIVRIVMGLGQGTTFPAVSNMLAKWIPKSEMSLVGAMVLGGSILGTVIANLTSGYMLTHWKWSAVFYIFGVAGAVWFIFFTLLCFSHPSDHPYISKEEKDFLLLVKGPDKGKLPPVPFGDILTSLPFISMVIATVGHDWGFYVMMIDLPKYMNDVLQFSIQNNGVYSALPFLCMYIGCIILGIVMDWIINTEILTITDARKINTIIAAVGPGAFMVGASYAGCNHGLVVFLFSCCLAIMSAYYVGVRLNPIDMSPNYAGTLMAMTNGFSAITGVLAAPIVGLMTPDTTLAQWRNVFWLTFGVLIASLGLYIIYGSSDVQPWDEGSVRKRPSH